MKDRRIGILGNVDSGKTTIISVLTNKILDNGRGFARSKILKHDHEKETGRTSCITHIYDKVTEDLTLSFVDLAGHEKYYKTTIFGANCCSLDCIMLMIGANMGVSHMTREHLLLALILKLPIIFVVSKIDLCPDNVMKNTLRDLYEIMKRYKCSKKIVEICDENMNEYYDFKDNNVFPLIKVSNTSGYNIDNLKNFLVNIKLNEPWQNLKSEKMFLTIEDIFQVVGVGIVISGTVNSGKIVRGGKYMLGPFNGMFYEVMVKTIHNNFRGLEDEIECGNSGCFNIKNLDKKFILKKSIIKRGMILIDKENKEHTYREFDAKVKILHHPTTIKENYETMIHCGTIKQVAKIVSIENELLRTGDQSNVRFRFIRRPEFIQKNKQIIFREGKTKGIGVVTELIK